MLALIVAASLFAVQDSGAFVVRLGNDTLSLEQYKRTATQLRGEYVSRAPRSVHRIYTADLNPDGSIRRWELVTHNIGGGPGPMETKFSVEFVGDTAVTVAPRGDSTVTQKVAVPRGTVPYGSIYGLVEQIARQARATGKDSVAISALSGVNAPSGGHVKKRGGDTLVLNFTEGQLAGLGPFTFRLDRQGRLTWLTGKGSTVQVEVERVASIPNLGALTAAFATRPLGQLSTRDTVHATIGGAELWVDYSRPQKRGRVIFGDVVPWNSVWRTGANAATQLSTSADLVIGGAAVPAGKYTLWTLPTPTGWKLIVNKNTGQWGTTYDPAHDLVRVDAKVDTLATPVEQFTIAFEPATAPTAITFAWDRTRYSVPVAKK
jgi:Protein of unknown function (DUF2911)